MTPNNAIKSFKLSSTELLRIRPSMDADQPHIDRMCTQGVAEGAFPLELPDPPTPAMGSGLATDERSEGYWIAEIETDSPRNITVAGMISLRPLDDHVVEARRLYVQPDQRDRGIGVQLLEQLIEMCKELGYLKVVLDVGIGSKKAVGLFGRLGFQLARERVVSDRTLLDFYLDIYRGTPQ